LFFDADHDGDLDLYIGPGGNNSQPFSRQMQNRLFKNDGKGNFKKKEDAFDSLFINVSCVVASDFNGDGYPDLFIGGRSVPYQYGQIPKSYLLRNDGTGKFSDVTDQYDKEISHAGFVTNAVWFDLNKDGVKDLIICSEWGGIYAFISQNGVFIKKVLTDKKGWWNFILPVDIDKDGHIDLIAGNLGLNSRLKASQQEPVRLYFADFDANGKKEQVLTYYLSGRELPFATREELNHQIPDLRRRFFYTRDFAKASLEDVFSVEKLRSADTLTADYFSNVVLMNDGHMNFKIRDLPWQAQLTPFRDAVVVNANDDSLPDILMFGNYYENNVQMGRNDADFGTILLNQGGGKFTAGGLNGLKINGQVRHVDKITIAGKEAYILARNDDSVRIIQFANKSN